MVFYLNLNLHTCPIYTIQEKKAGIYHTCPTFEDRASMVVSTNPSTFLLILAPKKGVKPLKYRLFVGFVAV